MTSAPAVPAAMPVALTACTANGGSAWTTYTAPSGTGPVCTGASSRMRIGAKVLKPSSWLALAATTSRYERSMSNFASGGTPIARRAPVTCTWPVSSSRRSVGNGFSPSSPSALNSAIAPTATVAVDVATGVAVALGNNVTVAVGSDGAVDVAAGCEVAVSVGADDAVAVRGASVAVAVAGGGAWWSSPPQAATQTMSEARARRCTSCITRILSG